MFAQTITLCAMAEVPCIRFINSPPYFFHTIFNITLEKKKQGVFDSAVRLFQKAKLNLQKDKPVLMHFIIQHWSLQDREWEYSEMCLHNEK